MRVPGIVYVNENLDDLMFDELKAACDRGEHGGGFLPAVKQIANVAALPGIVSVCILSFPSLESHLLTCILRAAFCGHA